MFEFGFKSDTGRKREINQDSFFVMPGAGIFLVADGVGGHCSGEVASRTAMTDMAAFIRENPVPAEDGDEALMNYFLSLISSVNDHVHQLAQGTEPRGMATTLLMLYIRNDTAYVINIGDSRAYLIRDEHIVKITEDHTFVNDLVKKGIITEVQARNHPDRNMITRAIGADETVKPDFYMFQIYSGDIILMCTDGLYNEVSEEDMCRTLLECGNMRDACAKLVDDANRNAGNDNITVISVRFSSDNSGQMS